MKEPHMNRKKTKLAVTGGAAGQQHERGGSKRSGVERVVIVEFDRTHTRNAVCRLLFGNERPGSSQSGTALRRHGRPDGAESTLPI